MGFDTKIKMVSSSTYYPLNITKVNKEEVGMFSKKVQTDRNLLQLKEIFLETKKNFKMIKCATNHRDVNILKLLDEIIPNRYFGSISNRRLFYEVVKKIISRSAYECIYKKSLSRHYKFEKMDWLQNYGQNKLMVWEIAVRRANIYLMETIVKPLIFHFFYPLRTKKSHEVKLIPRPDWKRFEDKVLNIFLQNNYLEFNVECVKLERRIAKMKKFPPRVRGKLEIIPKGVLTESTECRPLIQFFHKGSGYHYDCKAYSKIIYDVAKKLSFIKTGSLYEHWKELTDRVGDKDLFGAKVDITDAFGNVNLKLLHDIITEADQFDNEAKQFIIRHITNQYVVFKKYKRQYLVWHWNHGLLQGDPLSSSLCALYMSYLDQKHLQAFNNEALFIHRTVDDYFVASTSALQVFAFQARIASIHNINNEKIQSNAIILKKQSRIEYHGQIFDLDTKNVKSLYKFPENCLIRHKFKFWNLNKPIEESNFETFLKRSMQFAYNCFHFKKLELNLIFNTEQTVLENFFEAMIYTAFKFDAAVMSRYERNQDMSAVSNILRKVVYKYSTNSIKKVKSCTGNYDTNSLNVPVFLKIGYRAFRLVLIKRGCVYRKVLKDFSHIDKFILMKHNENINFKYFTKIPPCFNNIRMKRQCIKKTTKVIC